MWFRELHCSVLLEGVSVRLTVHREEDYGTFSERNDENRGMLELLESRCSG